jgi:hypothetical protein
MKITKYLFYLLSFAVLFSACSDDEKGPGKPVLNIKSSFDASYFGDSIPFVVNVSDQDGVPLSTVKLKLYFDEEMVSEKTIRTKSYGDYSGKLFVPFLPDIPNGTARLEIALQNINMTIEKQSLDLNLSRPDFPYLTLVSGAQQYRLERTGLYQYEATADFPSKLPGYIVAPAYGTNGNEIVFGWESDAVVHNSSNDIPFSNIPGVYTVSFNTLTYAAAPFIIAYTINGDAMKRIDDEHFFLDMMISQGESLEVEGIDGFDSWWIDPDFFSKADDGTLTFLPISGNYRIIADFNNSYLKVEVIKNGAAAGLESDGTGAIWIIGDSQGKPTKALTGWNPDIALCMAPMGNGKYQTTFVAGQTIESNRINFVFFHVKGWWPSFNPDNMTVQSELVRMGTGSVASGGNGIDKGNIALAEGKTLTDGKSYVFIVDVSAGIDKAVLTVTEN